VLKDHSLLTATVLDFESHMVRACCVSVHVRACVISSPSGQLCVLQSRHWVTHNSHPSVEEMILLTLKLFAAIVSPYDHCKGVMQATSMSRQIQRSFSLEETGTGTHYLGYYDNLLFPLNNGSISFIATFWLNVAVLSNSTDQKF